MRRVVDEAFCSSWGDQAIDLLGDLAFQDGRFSEAISLYRRLVPDPDRPAISLLYPGPDVDLAQVAAKILLARSRRRIARAPPATDLEAYARQYPDASGRLAGRKGPYLVSLIEALKADEPEPRAHARRPLAHLRRRSPAAASSPQAPSMSAPFSGRSSSRRSSPGATSTPTS